MSYVTKSVLRQRLWKTHGEFSENFLNHDISTSSSETSINILLKAQWVEASYIYNVA